jgi:phosphate-selective porin OprO and OprP
MKHFRILLPIMLVVALANESFSQTGPEQSKPALDFFYKKGKGFGLVTKDSIFSLNFQFRMQNRAAIFTKSEGDFDPEQTEFRVRRLRFKFEGFVYNPKLTYYIQLSVSRGDMDWRGPDNNIINSSPNIVRDAVIYYSPTKQVRFGFGQTKLPGNRQRVVSSGDQQFVDRSLVNATFNIDRDFGFFAQYIGRHINLKGALTSGEGRNALPEKSTTANDISSKGLAYTGRIEFLPLGKFTGNNDYVEGDLEREKTPKLSIASTYSYNDNAARTAGQLGGDLFRPRTIKNFEADLLFKYNGWAFYSEYMKRDANNPTTISKADPTKTSVIYVGEGYLGQLSYLFKNNIEVAGRLAHILPIEELEGGSRPETQQAEFGVTKYLVGHRLKVQGNILHESRHIDGDYSGGRWGMLFQVELGI